MLALVATSPCSWNLAVGSIFVEVVALDNDPKCFAFAEQGGARLNANVQSNLLIGSQILDVFLKEGVSNLIS